MTRTTFNLTTCGLILLQFLVSYLSFTFLTPVIGNGILAFLIALSGVILVAFDNVKIKLTGASLLSIGCGLNLTFFNSNVVGETLTVVGGITFCMYFISNYFRAFFDRVGNYLFLSLFVFVLAGIGCGLLGLSLAWYAYVGLFIFTMYLGYDLNRLQSVEPTFENAIDSSVNLYLDLINLIQFVSQILGDDD